MGAAFDRFMLTDMREHLTVLTLARFSVLRVLELEELWDVVEGFTAGTDREFALQEHGRVVDEIEADFPHLNRLGVIWQWTVLEAFVEDLVVQMLLAEPDLMNAPHMRNLRVRPDRVAGWSDEERVRLLVARATLQMRRQAGTPPTASRSWSTPPSWPT